MLTRSGTLFIICMAAIILYLLQWIDLPLYPDEVAMRLRTARLFADGTTLFGFFGFCPSNVKQIPLALLPAAYSYAVIDRFSGWSLVRWIPFGSILLLAGSLYGVVRRRENNWAILLICSGFIGVAASGLMLSRPEYVLLLRAAVCLFTYGLLKRPVLSHTARALAIIGNIYICDLSVFAHVQGLLLLPVSALLILRLLRPRTGGGQGLALLALAGFVTLFVVSSERTFAFRCSEDPPLEAAVAQLKTTDAIAAGDSLMEVSGRHFYYYLHDFLFMPRVPGLDTGHVLMVADPDYAIAARAINPFLLFLALANMACVAAIFIVTLRRFYCSLAASRLRWQGLYTLLADDVLLICYLSFAWLFLFFEDAVGNFYRNDCLNLLAACLTVLALSTASRRWVRGMTLGIGAVAFFACAASTVQARLFIIPLLEARYVGPGLPLDLNWAWIKRRIGALENTCHVDDAADNIVIDDLTYDALKMHRHLIPITYLWYRDALVGPAVPEGETHAAMLQKISTAVIAMCPYFDAYHIPYQYKDGSLCCTHF